MRIVIVTDTYLPDRNGVSKSIDGFTQLLIADGHQVCVLCPKVKNYTDKKQKNLKIVRYASITAPSYQEMHMSLPFLGKIMRDIKSFKPDIVHIQTPISLGWMGTLATRMLKINNLMTYHTYIPDFLVYFKPKNILKIDKLVEYFRGQKDERPRDSIITNKTLVRTMKRFSASLEKADSRMTNRFAREYTRVVYNQTQLVLTPSDAMRKILVKQGVKSKVAVLSNGIDFDFFPKKRDYTFSHKMVYFGRLGFEKNVDVVIKAFAEAHKRNSSLRLDIWGDGPAIQTLKKLAISLGVSETAVFHGSYDLGEFSKKLLEYDFFLTASTIETQGIVLLEAMAAGLPVLGVSKLAVPEVVLDGQDGYLSKPASVKGMAKNILKMYESVEKNEKFGKKALEIAASHEIHKCKDRLIEYYQQVIDEY